MHCLFSLIDFQAQILIVRAAVIARNPKLIEQIPDHSADEARLAKDISIATATMLLMLIIGWVYDLLSLINA